MLSLSRTLSWRYLRKRWSRTVLVVASIALGVATLVATRALNQSMRAASEDAISPMAGMADLTVDNGEAWVRRDLCDQLREVPGVKRAEPVIAERILVPELPGRSILMLGVGLTERLPLAGKDKPEVDFTHDNPWGVKVDLSGLGEFTLQDLLIGRKPVLLGKDLARELDRRFSVRASSQPRAVVQVGTVAIEGPAAAFNKSLLIMDVKDAAELLERSGGLVSRIDLFLEPGANREQVRQQVAAAMTGQAAVRTRESQAQALQEVMAGLELGFSLCGAGALVVGLFLVYNALSVSVAERRHDIGIMRSLGATRGQVARLFAGEAIVLGLAGTALGIPLGRGLAGLALGPISRTLSDILIPMEATHVVVTPGTILWAGFAGVATALLAALVPSTQAAFGHPADAVRRVPTAAGFPFRLFQIGLLLAVVGVAGFLIRRQLPTRVGLFGGVALVLLGCFLAAPLCAALLAQALHPLTRRFGGVGVRLAADNLVRVPGRTGMVIAAVAAVVTLMMQTAGVIHSNQGPILNWIDQTLTAELYVTAGGPIDSPNQNVAVTDTFAQQLAALPGVEAVLPVRFRRVDFQNTVVLLTTFDTQLYHDINRQRGSRLRDLELFQRLAQEPNSVVISENLAALYQVRTGDTIALGGPDGPIEFRVIGQLLDYSWNRGTVLIHRNQYLQRFRDSRVDVFDVYAQRGQDAELLRQRVEDWGAGQAMFVRNRAEVYEHFRDVVRRVYGIAYLQEVVVGVVAALGVVTALLISVLQRQRELGLLRAVGATRGQILWSVLAEAILMGLIGTAIGLLIGVPFEWYVLQVVIWEESGYFFPVLVPWIEAVGIAALAMVVATLAGLGPALHAMRLRIAEAIAYE